jgi:hypothetical protein
MLRAEGKALGSLYTFRTELNAAVNIDPQIREVSYCYMVQVRKLHACTLYGCLRTQPGYDTYVW